MELLGGLTHPPRTQASRLDLDKAGPRTSHHAPGIQHCLCSGTPTAEALRAVLVSVGSNNFSLETAKHPPKAHLPTHTQLQK